MRPRDFCIFAIVAAGRPCCKGRKQRSTERARRGPTGAESSPSAPGCGLEFAPSIAHHMACVCTRDAVRWRWSRLPIVRAAADGWTTLALQRASDHFERRLLDGESVVPVLHRLRRLSAKFSQDDRHALQNWLLLRVTARQPDMVAATFHALSAWPQAPAAPSLDVQPQQPCCAARGVDDRRLHAAFARLCATAYAYEPVPRLWALRAETTLLRPGQVRLELHCDATRVVVEVNPLFAPSEPLLAHVLLHELEHVHAHDHTPRAPFAVSPRKSVAFALTPAPGAGGRRDVNAAD